MSRQRDLDAIEALHGRMSAALTQELGGFEEHVHKLSSRVRARGADVLGRPDEEPAQRRGYAPAASSSDSSSEHGASRRRPAGLPPPRELSGHHWRQQEPGPEVQPEPRGIFSEAWLFAGMVCRQVSHSIVESMEASMASCSAEELPRERRRRRGQDGDSGSPIAVDRPPGGCLSACDCATSADLAVCERSGGSSIGSGSREASPRAAAVEVRVENPTGTAWSLGGGYMRVTGEERHALTTHCSRADSWYDEPLIPEAGAGIPGSFAGAGIPGISSPCTVIATGALAAEAASGYKLPTACPVGAEVAGRRAGDVARNLMVCQSQPGARTRPRARSMSPGAELAFRAPAAAAIGTRADARQARSASCVPLGRR